MAMSKIDINLYQAFGKYIETNKRTYIQIGAGAGDRDPRSNFRDGFTEYVKSLDRNKIEEIIVVEPNPLNIDKLKETWKDYPETIILSFGISSGSMSRPTVNFYYTEEDAPHYQVFSSDKEHVRKHYPESNIKEMEVSCISFSEFINRYIKSKTVEMLALDIEGLEADLILETDWKSLNVNQLSFENIHLGDRNNAVAKKLSQDGYFESGIGLDHNGYDVLYKKNIGC
jgi:FkbM family methyltransferase